MSESDSFLFPLRFILYLLFRIARSIVQLESDLVAFVRRLSTNERTDVEFFSILSRYRFDVTDVVRETDFLLFNESFGEFEEIVEPEWMIYSMTTRYVYLVKVPDTECTIDKYSRLGDFLHCCAERAARVDMDLFIERTKHFPPFASRVVFLHSVACSGGTVAARMLQACDPTYRNLEVFGEPPVVTSLALLTASLPIEKLRRLTLASLRFALYHQQVDQTVVYKTRMNSARCIPYIHCSCPSIIHCLITSKNMKASISRLLRKTAQDAPIFSIICRLMTDFPWLSDIVSQWRQMQARTVTLIAPKNAFEFATALTLGASNSFDRCMPYFGIDPIYFEDLISETARLMAPLLDICEMSDLSIPDAIEWKRNEEGQWRTDWNTSCLTEEEERRVDLLTDLLQGDWSI